MTNAQMIDIINTLIGGRDFYDANIFFAKLDEEKAKNRNTKLILLISWNSLNTQEPLMTIAPIADISPPSVRYKLVDTYLDAIIQLPMTKETFDSIHKKEITKTRAPLEKIVEIFIFCYVNHPKLSTMPVNFKDLVTLSILTEALMTLQRLNINNAIEMVLSAYQINFTQQVQLGIEEIDKDKKISKTLEKLYIKTDRHNINEYINFHEYVCVYSTLIPLKTIEIPFGCGFSDLLPKIYIIEPVFVVCKVVKDKSKYLLLYKNSTEDINVDEIQTKLRETHYLAAYLPFDMKEDSIFVQHILKSRMNHPNN